LGQIKIMNIQAYLKRINFTQSLKADKATLFQLHQAHLYNVPFEDLNIHYDIPIILKERDLFQKVIEGNRGGFCYELNGLFNELLKNIGFQTTIIAAKVINKEGEIGPPFDHAALIVDLEKRWLVDVGYGGDSFILPKELVLDRVQKDIHASYKFTKYSENEWLLMHTKEGENFKAQYIFSFEAQQLDNFKPECDRKQTQPDSHFRKNFICTKAMPTGRISMINDKFIRKIDGQKETRLIENESDRLTILAEDFDIPTDDLIAKRNEGIK